MTDSYAPIYGVELTETVNYIEKAFRSILENVDGMRFEQDNNSKEAYLNRAKPIARGSIERFFVIHFLDDLNWRLEGAPGTQERHLCDMDFKSKKNAALWFAVKKHQKERSGRSSPSEQAQAEIATHAGSDNNLGNA